MLTRFSSFLRAEDQWRKDHGTAPMTVGMKTDTEDESHDPVRGARRLVEEKQSSREP